MNDEQLLRYSRHILRDEIGIEGQQRLLDSHALIIGAGGLGSPVALYLGGAGVGTLTLVDHDTVDLTNLQRHLENGKDQEAKSSAPVKPAPTPAQAVASEPPKPIELGSKEDFQLAQSIAFLKGEPLKGQTPSVAQSKPAEKSN